MKLLKLSILSELINMNDTLKPWDAGVYMCHFLPTHKGGTVITLVLQIIKIQLKEVK